MPFFSVVGPGQRIVAERHLLEWLDIDSDDSEWTRPVRVADTCPLGIRRCRSLLDRQTSCVDRKYSDENHARERYFGQ
jgi:hypothetical protein